MATTLFPFTISAENLEKCGRGLAGLGCSGGAKSREHRFWRELGPSGGRLASIARRARNSPQFAARGAQVSLCGCSLALRPRQG